MKSRNPLIGSGLRLFLCKNPDTSMREETKDRGRVKAIGVKLRNEKADKSHLTVLAT